MKSSMCTTADQLAECITCDPTNMPVVEGNLFQTSAPISQGDVNFLSGGVDQNNQQTGIDFFSDAGPSANTDPTNPISASRDGGLVRVGLRFRTEFILDSICVKLHCEPQAMAIDGNQFFNQSQVTEVPTSPEEFNWDVPLSDGTWLQHCNAQLEVGSPIWRASHWALQAYRMSLQCPSSPRIHEIMKQRLVDLGNCCLGTEYEGFGMTDASPRDFVNNTNRKLFSLTSSAQCPILPTDPSQGISCVSNGITAANQDLGYFVPFNARQKWNMDPASPYAHRYTEASRMKVAHSAFGSAVTSPGAFKWFRLAIPRVIGKDENIEISLTRSPQDAEFFQRMIRELSYQACSTMLPNQTRGVVAITLGDGASYTSMTSANYVRIPAGLWRFGIALKGWLLDANLCGTVKQRMNSMSLTEWRALPEAQQRAQYGTGRICMPSGGTTLQGVLQQSASGSCGCG